MVLAIFPFAGVPAQSLIKDQIAERLSLAFQKVAEIYLLNFLGANTLGEHGNEADSTGLA